MRFAPRSYYGAGRCRGGDADASDAGEVRGRSRARRGAGLERIRAVPRGARVRGTLRQHLCAHPEGHFRAPRLYQLLLPRRSGGGRSQPPPRNVAYDNLVDAPVQSIAAKPPLVRVYPSKKENSLLWINLAAATLPDQWKAPLRPMLAGGIAAADVDKLNVVRLWIEHGAPRQGVVDGTGALLDACLPPPEPLQTAPLAPPPAGTGIQLRAPRQILAAHTEREVSSSPTTTSPIRCPSRFPRSRWRHLPLQTDRRTHGSAQPSCGGDSL